MSQLEEQILNGKIYAFLEQAMISDVKDFLITSENNVDIQYTKELDRIRLLDAESNLPIGYLSGLQENAKLRFEINLPINIRYSAIVLLVTTIEWSIKNLNKQLEKPLLINGRDSMAVDSIKKLSSDIGLQKNEVIEDIEAIVYVRNCIAHSAGILNDYKHYDTLPVYVERLNGFTFNNVDFIKGYLWIERNALNPHIDAISNFIFLLFKTCYEKDLVKVR